MFRYPCGSSSQSNPRPAVASSRMASPMFETPKQYARYWLGQVPFTSPNVKPMSPLNWLSCTSDSRASTCTSARSFTTKLCRTIRLSSRCV